MIDDDTVERGIEATSDHPERPPLPTFLTMFEERLHHNDGTADHYSVITDDEKHYPFTRAWIKCDPDNPLSLRGCR